MKWRDMTPEQRDALIAEKVMEFHVEHWAQKTCTSIDEDGDTVVHDLVTGYRVIHEPGTIPRNRPVSHYTHSLDAAWKVLSHLGISFIVLERMWFTTSDTWGNDVWLWHCQVRFCGTLFSSTAKHPAEAICHAVVKAMKLQDEVQS